MNTLYTTKLISFFLAILLITGTITAFYPSLLSMKKVYAKPDFHKDTLVCNNINLNFNGLRVDALAEQISNLLRDKPETENVNGDTYIDSREGKSNYYKDFSSICINNNDNELAVPPNPPIPPPTQPIDENVYVVWQDILSDIPFNRDILFSFSTNNGPSFSTPANNISKSSGESTSPQIATQGDNVYLVWDDGTPIEPSAILFSFSTNNGQSFSTPTNLSNHNGAVLPEIVAKNNNIYVIWTEGLDIFFSISTNNGQSFSTPTNISQDSSSFQQPQMVVQGDNIYVVWTEGISEDSEIFFSFSTNNGQSFSTPVNISQTSEGSELPQIAAQGDNVYIVWTENPLGNANIRFSFSTNNGETFSTLNDISQNNGGSFPQIAAQGDNVYVVWSNGRDIFFSISTNNGQSFNTPINISQNMGFSQEPQIVVHEDHVYLVWYDSTFGNNDILFSISTNNGQSFSKPVNISNNNGSSNFPQITVWGNSVFVVWQDFTPGNGEIFFSISTNNGQSFSTPVNISKTNGDSQIPQIAIQQN